MSQTTQAMQALFATSYLSGGNAAYVENLYEDFLRDPQMVEPHWREFFQQLGDGGISHAQIREKFRNLAKSSKYLAGVTSTASHADQKQAQVAALIQAYRCYGHHHAALDPLGLTEPKYVADLELSYHGLNQGDLKTIFNTANWVGASEMTLQALLEALQETYCASIGTEYMHISNTEQVRWIQQRLESVLARPNFSTEQKQRILKLLIMAEGLEKYLGAKYVGQKRFSLEGGESLIPLLDCLIHNASQQQTKEVVIGMAHRGRLNVLVNVLGKSPRELFDVFEGKRDSTTTTGSGDVKYHMGFSSDIKTEQGSLHLALAFNPSHLEIVSPVIIGSVRARQHRRQDNEHKQVLPVVIHGDAAFSGQGVVMETLNMSQTRGFTVGGTVHIIINNQVGFTTSEVIDARSTPYCTDVAKMIEAPIFHVNGDDPEAVIFVTQLALDFRMQFKKDVIIDLVCYRRHGHNEADEPSATQPVMYQRIKKQTPTPKRYAEQLIAAKVCDQALVDRMIADYRATLDAGLDVVSTIKGGSSDKFITDWSPYLNQTWEQGVTASIPLASLQALAKKIESVPDGMTLQPQVAKMMEERRKMTQGESPLNWGYAETLAYATLLQAGYPIRLTGQDSGRGTFAHRHAVLHDYQTGKCYIPLQHINEKQANFTITDSLLSEEAVMAFEYGYATAEPTALVIWEAQFGDFANGAQVVIDQFISSGEQKWGRLCGLVLLLPHGFEGQGPEHSSARLERFLQLCAQNNMQVCVPTTPAQCFHMLRRQVLRPYRKPLIVMTPKSLLRHKLAVSTLQELAQGYFQLVIPEIDKLADEQVQRIILCSGKVYYDLLEQRRASQRSDTAIIRIEQLYPFPVVDVKRELQRYKKAKMVIWCQEEPKNQGAWYALAHRLSNCLLPTQRLEYVGREASASPAVGSNNLHLEQQQALVKQALEGTV